MAGKRRKRREERWVVRVSMIEGRGGVGREVWRFWILHGKDSISFGCPTSPRCNFHISPAQEAMPLSLLRSVMVLLVLTPQIFSATLGSILCGGHHAASCADCPQGNGAAWCKSLLPCQV